MGSFGGAVGELWVELWGSCGKVIFQDPYLEIMALITDDYFEG